MKKWTLQERDFLSRNYPEHGKLWCAEKLNRKEGSVRWMASEMGLKQNKSSEFFNEWQQRAAKSKIGKKRPEQAEVMRRIHAEGKFAYTPERMEQNRQRMKKWHEVNEHPRGMLGKTHTAEERNRISKRFSGWWASLTDEEKGAMVLKGMKTREKSGRLHSTNREKASWKCGWREIGGKRKYYRSRWEANYARYLEWLKVHGEIADWEHEPKVFWFEEIKRGCRSYLPDFKVVENNGDEIFHEVKGWMDDRSKTKIKRMAKYHPSVVLIVIDSPAYTKIASAVGRLIDGWE